MQFYGEYQEAYERFVFFGCEVEVRFEGALLLPSENFKYSQGLFLLEF